jgi:hypothetical protein
MIDHPRSTCELCGLWLGAVERYVSNVCRECRGAGGKQRNQCAWPGCSKAGVVKKSLYVYAATTIDAAVADRWPSSRTEWLGRTS